MDAEDAATRARARWREQRDSKACCVRCLVELAQQIERYWDADGGAVRLALLAVFREALVDLAESRHAELRWIGVHGRNMKSLDCSLTHFLNLALPLEREHTRGLQEFEFLAGAIEAADGPERRAAAIGAVGAGPRAPPLHVVLDNMRSAFNVGSIVRTAECLGVRTLHLCGYTATPDDAQVQSTAMGAHAYIEWERSRTALEAIERLAADGVPSIALETVRDAPLAWDFAFPSPCALVLGNERHGLGPDVLAACAGTVQLPCVGVKNSMNVGVAFGMCAHEIARQWHQRAAHGADALASAQPCAGAQGASPTGALALPRGGHAVCAPESGVPSVPI